MSKSTSLTLQSVLKQYPPPRSVLIHDCFSLQAKPILTSMIKHAVRLRKCKIHVFLFENSVEKFKKTFTDHNILVYDYVGKNKWVTDQKCGNFLSTIADEFYDGIIVIDSLIHVIIEYGLAETYRALYQLLYRNDRCIIQFITVLHEDILENMSKIQEYFKNIVTLSMNLLEVPKRSPRVKYYYRKSSSKIIQETKEYYFEGENFCTRPIERLDAQALLANAKIDVQPHELATFKIDLNENDKKLKDKFQLPYLRTLESEVSKPGDGTIIYNLDENDDWDEEDPDDDLDI